jgi:hypothetical protein
MFKIHDFQSEKTFQPKVLKCVIKMNITNLKSFLFNIINIMILSKIWKGMIHIW